jgi:hypothetical protein
MLDAIQEVLSQLAAGVDSRFSLFDIRVEGLKAGRLVLTGRVLGRSQLETLASALSGRFPDLSLDLSHVRVLDQGGLPCAHIHTNLAGMYERPSFGVPLLTELYYGTGLQLLDQNESWAFVRLKDGYLGWVYIPYLDDGEGPEPTHLVMAPSVELWDRYDMHGSIVTRLVSGTGVLVDDVKNHWAHVRANGDGWMPNGLLRSVNEFPHTKEERRSRIILDSAEMIGTPYLWGGMSGNGIDCSGLSVLLHRWIGVEIPRDADLQCAAARPIEPPFRPGDLLFFDESGRKQRATHVGVSLGGWKMIHSSRRRNGVYIEDVEKVEPLRQIFMCAGSFLRDDPARTGPLHDSERFG